jgi:hypothetical protein
MGVLEDQVEKNSRPDDAHAFLWDVLLQRPLIPVLVTPPAQSAKQPCYDNQSNPE